MPSNPEHGGRPGTGGRIARWRGSLAGGTRGMFSSDLALYVALGFAAQLVDGALGMAYGLLCTSALLATGVLPAVASASVHAAEVVTTGLAGRSQPRQQPR